MPPKPKFTREEIIEAALEIVRSQGPRALTARALGDRLGSSARPIFTVFHSIEEVQKEVLSSARRLYNDYIQEGLSRERLPFKGVGEQYIRFAMEEPWLFQLLFMREQAGVPGVGLILPLIDENYELILRSVQEEYGIERLSAHSLYQNLWIYTHGIASLCVTGMCRFSEKEISDMLTEVFKGLLLQKKRGENND